MKAVCKLKRIKEKVMQAERITGKNLSLPILNSILILIEKKSILIRSTNLDLGVEFSIPATVESEGQIAIPGSVLSGVLSSLPDDSNITLEVVSDNLVISTDKSTTLVKGVSSEDFPTLPKVTSGKTLHIPADVFVLGVKSVWYSAAVTDIKPEFSSVYIYKDEEYIVFVSTDSFRLAEKRIKVKNVQDFTGIIVPIKNINEIIKVLGSLSGEVGIVFDENQVSFTGEGVFLVSRIVNGVYPDYRQIIPKDFTSEVKVLKDNITDVLKLTNILSDRFHKISISTNVKNKGIEFSSKNNDVGENMSTVKAVITGDDFSANFNFRYILDGFQSMSQDSVLFKFDSKKDVLIIQGIGDDSFTYLVKPMNK